MLKRTMQFDSRRNDGGSPRQDTSNRGSPHNHSDPTAGGLVPTRPDKPPRVDTEPGATKIRQLPPQQKSQNRERLLGKPPRVVEPSAHPTRSTVRVVKQQLRRLGTPMQKVLSKEAHALLRKHEKRTNHRQRARAQGGREGGWVRDLTREGVEPNPGPTAEHNTRRAANQIIALRRSQFRSAIRPLMVDREQGTGVLIIHDRVMAFSAYFALLAYALPELHRDYPEQFDYPMFTRHMAELTAVMPGWLRDLTREGVEPNPGPPKVTRVMRADLAACHTQPCARPSHWHKQKRGAGNGPAPDGAALRKAMAMANREYVLCKTPGCGEPTHFHPARDDYATPDDARRRFHEVAQRFGANLRGLTAEDAARMAMFRGERCQHGQQCDQCQQCDADGDEEDQQPRMAGVLQVVPPPPPLLVPPAQAVQAPPPARRPRPAQQNAPVAPGQGVVAPAGGAAAAQPQANQVAAGAAPAAQAPQAGAAAAQPPAQVQPPQPQAGVAAAQPPAQVQPLQQAAPPAQAPVAAAGGVAPVVPAAQQAANQIPQGVVQQALAQLNVNAAAAPQVANAAQAQAGLAPPQPLPQVVDPVAVQRNALYARLAPMTPPDRYRELGARLYPLVQPHSPDRVGSVVATMLSETVDALVDAVVSPNTLTALIRRAEAALEIRNLGNLDQNALTPLRLHTHVRAMSTFDEVGRYISSVLETTLTERGYQLDALQDLVNNHSWHTLYRAINVPRELEALLPSRPAPVAQETLPRTESAMYVDGHVAGIKLTLKLANGVPCVLSLDSLTSPPPVQDDQVADSPRAPAPRREYPRSVMITAGETVDISPPDHPAAKAFHAETNACNKAGLPSFLGVARGFTALASACKVKQDTIRIQADKWSTATSLMRLAPFKVECGIVAQPPIAADPALEALWKHSPTATPPAWTNYLDPWSRDLLGLTTDRTTQPLTIGHDPYFGVVKLCGGRITFGLAEIIPMFVFVNTQHMKTVRRREVWRTMGQVLHDVFLSHGTTLDISMAHTNTDKVGAVPEKRLMETMQRSNTILGFRFHRPVTNAEWEAILEQLHYDKLDVRLVSPLAYMAAILDKSIASTNAISASGAPNLNYAIAIQRAVAQSGVGPALTLFHTLNGPTIISDTATLASCRRSIDNVRTNVGIGRALHTIEELGNSQGATTLTGKRGLART